jgi:2-octaprenyl-6-methoxyphenol hydroxylase
VTKPNNKPDYDVVIVGGGMVGMAAALSLSQLNLSIALLESQVVEGDSHPSYDDRTLVVNQASVCFWKNLGIWQKLKQNITPINKVHVSNKGYFGSVNFDKDELNVDALAYIVEAKILGFALKHACEENESITAIAPASFKQMQHKKYAVEVNYTMGESIHTISAKLMLAADGIQSGIRKQLGLETIIKSYQRTAIICNITPEQKHKNCAFERLTDKGPTAILPFVSNRCGFVWTVENAQAQEILDLSDEDFIQKAQQQFGYRLGKFIKAGKRSSYPLYLVTVPQQVKNRVILIGNAAHGMSPVSAQGLNLAVRDVARLFDVLQEKIQKSQDIGADESLNTYQNAINTDQQQTMRYTDDLMSWFKIDEPIIATLRSISLFAMNQSKHLKQELFHRASGYRGQIPQLLRKKT